MELNENSLTFDFAAESAARGVEEKLAADLLMPSVGLIGGDIVKIS